MDPHSIRTSLGLTQAEMARLLGTTRGAYRDMEVPGARLRGPTRRLLQAIDAVPTLATTLDALARLDEAEADRLAAERLAAKADREAPPVLEPRRRGRPPGSRKKEGPR